MSESRAQLFILYQMGSSEDYTWYSVVAVFMSEKSLWDYARLKGIEADLKLMDPDGTGGVALPEPLEFVAVRSREGEVPDVEFAQKV